MGARRAPQRGARPAARPRRPRRSRHSSCAHRPPRDGVLIAVSHEGGTRITNEAVRAARAGGCHDRPRHRERSVPRRGARRPRDRDRGAGPELVPHRRLPLAARGRCRARRAHHRIARRRGRHPRTARRGHDPHAAASGPHPWLASTASSWRDRAATTSPRGSWPSRSRKGPGCRRPRTSWRRCCTATWRPRRDGPASSVVMTDAGHREGSSASEPCVCSRRPKALGVPAAAIVAESIAADMPDELDARRVGSSCRIRGASAAWRDRCSASAMALQLLTERLARARGVNPDTLGREDPAQAAAHA